MKKIFSLLLCCFMIFGLVGCGSSDSKNETADTPTKEETKKELSFDTIKKALQDNGYSITKETTMGADLIGAKSGIKYATDKGSIEFYQFDKTSDAYKKAEKDGVVSMEGFGDFKVVLNNDFAMMSDKKSEDLIKLFKSL